MFHLILKAYQEVAVMSALGQKQTCAVQTGHVRFTPESLVAKLRWDTTLSPRSAICAF